MMSNSISLLGALGLALCFGCGGNAGAPAPASPAPASAETAEAPDEAAAATETGTEGAEDTAAEAAEPAPSATALGPQISSGEVRFNFKPSFKVKKIYLAGNFNGWKPSDDDYLLRDEDGDGIWSITVKLDPGSYQYKFVVDGQWTKDAHAPSSKPDGFGGYNGAFEVP